MTTQTPQPGEVWTTIRNGIPLTFVGPNPKRPGKSVWVTADGKALTYALDQLAPPNPFPFKAGDVLKNVNAPYLYVVVDPQPDREYFDSTVIERLKGDTPFEIDHLQVMKMVGSSWVKQ